MESDEYGFMPEEVVQAYEVWLGPALRSPTETARILGIPKPRVANWVLRHRWKERALSDDLESRDGAVAAARASMAGLLNKAVVVASLTLDARLDDAGNPPPNMPTTQASKYAFQTLSLFGISPQRHVSIDVSERAAISVSDAELDALIAAGDMDTLLALASGKPMPTAAQPPHPWTFRAPSRAGGKCRTHLHHCQSIPIVIPSPVTSSMPSDRPSRGMLGVTADQRRGAQGDGETWQMVRHEGRGAGSPLPSLCEQKPWEVLA